MTHHRDDDCDPTKLTKYAEISTKSIQPQPQLLLSDPTQTCLSTATPWTFRVVAAASAPKLHFFARRCLFVGSSEVRRGAGHADPARWALLLLLGIGGGGLRRTHHQNSWTAKPGERHGMVGCEVMGVVAVFCFCPPGAVD